MDSTSASLLSGSVPARAGNAFASEKPLGQSLMQRLAVSGLKLPKGMEMVGGPHGRKPEMGDMRRLAELLEKEWGAKHHERKTFEEHLADVKLRFGTISAPTFIAYGCAGWPDAVLFPIRASRTPANDAEMLGAEFWNTDFAEGPIFAVRKSLSDSEFALGLERALIERAFLPYARALAGMGEISGAFFYTWRLNGASLPGQHMREREMHLSLGAVPARTFLGGRIEEMAYSHLLI